MLFKKETKTQPERPDRIKNLSDIELRGWLNACLMELGAAYDQWAFHNAPSGEFDKVLDLVRHLWNELQSRPK